MAKNIDSKIRPQINITVDASGDEDNIILKGGGGEYLKTENTPQSRGDSSVARMMQNTLKSLTGKHKNQK